MRRTILAGAALAVVAVSPASAYIITFDAQGLTGPSTAAATSVQTINVSVPIGTVTFSGGAILTQVTFLPADRTSVYYNSSFLPGSTTDVMTILFPQPVTNFLMYLYNGWTSPDTFTISNGLGGSVTASNVPANFSSGVVPVLFGDVGTQVTISTTNPNYDFVIDNVQFDQGTTPGVPETSTWGMMMMGFAALAFAAVRRSRTGRAVAPAGC